MQPAKGASVAAAMVFWVHRHEAAQVARLLLEIDLARRCAMRQWRFKNGL
jgi:hypothetical protein